MAAEARVSADADLGRRILQAMHEAGLNAKAALWVLCADPEGWKLMIALPEAGRDLQEAYVRVARLLDATASLKDFGLSRILLVPPDERMLQVLGKVLQVEGLSAVRFSQNMVDGFYIDDALIYRLAA